MLQTRSFALAAAALVLTAATGLAGPPGFVSPPNTYHYPSARDVVSPAQRTTSNYFAVPQSYYLRPYSPEPRLAPQNPPAPATNPPGGSPLDLLQSYYLRPYSPEPSLTPQNPTVPATNVPPGDLPLVPRPRREPAPPPPEPAEIEVRVPAGAELWFNGEKTTQTGSVRQFRSPPLEPGARYAYDIKARWTENGKEVERTLHVPLTAGARQKATFRE
jgi:uncharacterized protein (TIGR03000 family)